MWLGWHAAERDGLVSIVHRIQSTETAKRLNNLNWREFSTGCGLSEYNRVLPAAVRSLFCGKSKRSRDHRTMGV